MSAALTRASAAARAQVPELNVQNGVLKALSFLFEYIGEMGKDYIYAVSPLLEDALMDRDLVHRQTAASVVQARALLVASRAPRPSWCAAAPPRALLHGTGLPAARACAACALAAQKPRLGRFLGRALRRRLAH